MYVLSALLAACGGGGDPMMMMMPDPVPAGIELSVSPARIFYRTDQTVMLAASVIDQYGEPMPDAAVTFAADPAGRATPGMQDVQSASFTLTGSGTILMTACSVDVPELCDSQSLVVDDGSPILEVETPVPGAELDDPAGIVVRGSVADQSGTLHVFVDGELVDVDAMGRFETTVPARFGVEHVEVVASDARTEVSRVEMDVLWAPGYTAALDAMGRPAVTMDEAVGLWLGQRFFDDGVPLDPAATPIETHDLADLLELVLLNADLAALIPDPVVDSRPTFYLRLLSPRITEPHVEVAIRDDGVDLFLRIGRLSATTAGQIVVDTQTLSLAGTVTATASAYARITVRKDSPEADVEVTLAQLVVALESIEGSFADPEAGAVFAIAAGLLRTTLETQVRDAVRGVVEDSVPALLRDVLVGIDRALIGQSITLDQPPLPRIELALDGRMSRIDTVYRREMLAPLRLSLTSSATSEHASSRGVARLDPTAMSPEYFRAGRVQVGVSLGMLNGVLHVLYGSGLLDLDVSSMLPSSVSGLVSSAQLAPRLPPILRPPDVDEASDLVLSVGQLELVLTYMGAPARFGVTLEAGVDVSVGGNRIAIDLAETADIRVWAIELPEGERLLTPELVAGLLADLWPELRASFANGLAFELPIPPLDLSAVAPSLTGLTLTLDETDARLYPRGELLLLDAALIGRVP
ncbi:MAG: hypothetical protein IT378_04915 [Sandaracinaceae bacterium]|nr:hypothetical protein [Sandaracinaceae bacterium]